MEMCSPTLEKLAVFLNAGLRALRCALVVTLLLSAQFAASQPAPMPELPERLAAIRAAQRQLAANADVSVGFIDTALRSASSLHGVPTEFHDEIIMTEHDLIGLLERLYPYYGFSGTETLEFENGGPGMGDMMYYFREYIGGIATNQLFKVRVDASGHISDFSLWLYLDRSLPREPEMSQQEAIDVALCFVGKLREFSGEDYQRDDAHDAEVVYETWGVGGDIALIPVWRVTPANARNRSRFEERFTIMPGSVVRRGSVSSHSDPKEPFLCADAEAIPDW